MSVEKIDQLQKLTTDAVPDYPDKNIKSQPAIIEEANKEKFYASNIGYTVNLKSKISTNANKNGKSSMKFPKQAKSMHTCTKVINISNSSSVHIGAVNNYNFNSHSKNQNRNIRRTPDVNKFLSNKSLVNTEHIDFISLHLGDGWRDVGECLGYSKGQMDNFYLDNKNSGHKEVVYQMLLDWIQANPDDSNIGVLATALWDTDNKDVLSLWIKNL